MEWTGWLFDIFDDPQDGVVLWLIADSGERVRLRQAFPITFYAAGPSVQLRALWRWLRAQGVPVNLARTERRDLFQPAPMAVLAIEVPRAADQPGLFKRVVEAFPDLSYYDADIHLALRHAARFGTFPLARVRVAADREGRVQELEALDRPWDLDPPAPPLRIMRLEPDCNPDHATPRSLLVQCDGHSFRFPLDNPRPLVINLRALIHRHDPDLLLTHWGDTWLLPRLLELVHQVGIPLALNREPGRGVARRAQRSYFSYGQIIYRGQQITLYGRWHLDCDNAVLWDDYSLAGTFEGARVTAFPMQQAARLSPGSGISAMQVTTALRMGALVPWKKQQVERPKSALDLLHSDMGGLVYQPVPGLHYDVGSIDFVSMYPSIMVRGNISPETHAHDPALQSPEPPGLIPQTLGPLLEKRIELKKRLAQMPAWHPARADAAARASAHKWLLVTCFGYLGYKNARFGRIEAHEAVTAGGREALLRAKEIAEEQGFTVLHMYVDALWVKKEGARQPADFEPLLVAIAERTGISIALDGVYRWVAFLPSRRDGRVPVANRYFGAFQDGSLKLRGLEARRRDTPGFVSETQRQLIACLGKADGPQEAGRRLGEAITALRRQLWRLRSGKIALENLLVGQKLSRKLAAYTTPSPAARAAAQLQALGRTLEPGQRVYFLWLRGQPDVHAWDLPEPPAYARLDIARYTELVLRAAEAVLQPFGLTPEILRAKAIGQPYAVPLPAPRRTIAVWSHHGAARGPVVPVPNLLLPG
jgi:DNA polymerase II